MKHTCLLFGTAWLLVLLFLQPHLAWSGEQPGYLSSNSRYGLMRTKHRAHKGFTNNGKVLYHYVSDEDVTSRNPSQIGNVRIRAGREIEEQDNGNLIVGAETGIREIYTGVKLYGVRPSGRDIRVGTVTVNEPNHMLDKVETNVKLGHAVRTK